MSYILTRDNTKIYYEDEGSGQTILLIHGWAANRNSFIVAKKYLSKNYRVITYDLRGHGLSEVTKHGLTMESFAMDLEDLICKIGLEDLIIMGWSMGAQVLFKYVQMYGCKRLKGIGIIDMTPKLINDDSWNLGLYNGSFTHEDNLTYLTGMCNHWMRFMDDFYYTVSQDLTEGQLKYIRKDNARNTPHVTIALWIAMAKGDYREVVTKINVPTIIMYGDKHTLYSKETFNYLNSHIPNSQLVKFEGCTHILVVENPVKFCNVVEAFIENIRD